MYFKFRDVTDRHQYSWRNRVAPDLWTHDGCKGFDEMNLSSFGHCVGLVERVLAVYFMKATLGLLYKRTSTWDDTREGCSCNECTLRFL